jgi:hypothetical protein
MIQQDKKDPDSENETNEVVEQVGEVHPLRGGLFVTDLVTLMDVYDRIHAHDVVPILAWDLVQTRVRGFVQVHVQARLGPLLHDLTQELGVIFVVFLVIVARKAMPINPGDVVDKVGVPLLPIRFRVRVHGLERQNRFRLRQNYQQK